MPCLNRALALVLILGAGVLANPLARREVPYGDLTSLGDYDLLAGSEHDGDHNSKGWDDRDDRNDYGHKKYYDEFKDLRYREDDKRGDHGSGRSFYRRDSSSPSKSSYSQYRPEYKHDGYKHDEYKHDEYKTPQSKYGAYNEKDGKYGEFEERNFNKFKLNEYEPEYKNEDKFKKGDYNDYRNADKGDYSKDDYKNGYKTDDYKKGDHTQAEYTDQKPGYQYDYKPEQKNDEHAKIYAEEAKSSHNKESYNKESDDNSYIKIGADVGKYDELKGRKEY